MKLSFLLSIFMFFHGIIHAQNRFVVHEWGTFSTLTASNGQQYEVPVRSLDKLPSFVYNQYYRYSTTSKHDGPILASSYLQNANMGMETPVIYFYTDEALDFQLNVNFHNGTISQFFPKPTITETFISPAAQFDLDGHTGYATWKGHIYEKSSLMNPTFSNQRANALWNHPREVASNIVELDTIREKYLFYRGLGYYNCPIQVENDLNRMVKITNNSNEFLPFYVCTEKVGDELLVHGFGSLEAGNCVSFSRNNNLVTDVKKIMIEALIAEGLYEDEAKAMIATWNESYFESSGLKVFWIVPQAIIDQLLPISVNPEPDELKRAFFGRIEVMEAEFEQMLQDYVQKGGILINLMNKYRYTQPYLTERISLFSHYGDLNDGSTQIGACNNEMETGKTDFDFEVFPNPANSEVFVRIITESAAVKEIQIIDQLGKLIPVQPQIEKSNNDGTTSIAIQHIPAGLYFIQVQVEDMVLTKKLLIQKH